MIEKSWYQTQTEALLKLSRYLLSEADSKALTHGEKHYLIQTALYLIHKATALLDGNNMGIERHEIDSLNASDIPF